MIHNESLKYTIDYGVTFECVPPSDARITQQQKLAMQARAKTHAIIITPPGADASERDRGISEALLKRLAAGGRIQSGNLLLSGPTADSGAYTFLADENVVMATIENGLMGVEQHNEIRTDMRLYTGMDAGGTNVSDMVGQGFDNLPQTPPPESGRPKKKRPRGGR